MTKWNKIRVKIIARGQPGSAWANQSPNLSGAWGECQFLFDLNERNYDWLVVIDDVSRKVSSPPEVLACPPENTLFVTTEPSSITHYGEAFTNQFEHVLTSQEPDALPHRNRIYSHTGNFWFHGRTFDQLTSGQPLSKTQNLSTVCSSKRQGHTMHAMRYDFTQWLKKQIPELEIYGHGVRFIEQKTEALDAFRFHLAIENHIAPHHWTEKLADPFLSFCVPIYCGCPNATDYFPVESFIQIDIKNPAESLDTIQSVIHDTNEYTRRLDAVIEARRKVMYEHNLLAKLDRIIQKNHTSSDQSKNTIKLYGRKQMRTKAPVEMISFVRWNIKQTFRDRFTKRKEYF
jgi:hypothetical protein